MNDRSSTVTPHVQAGPYRFGMTPAEVELAATTEDVWYNFEYDAAGLAAVYCNIDAIDSLVIAGEDLAQMSRLDAALYVASLSETLGQAMGGSLYFDDIGIAMLQYESPIRELIFFAAHFDHGEGLRPMTPASIRAYHDEQVRGWT